MAKKIRIVLTLQLPAGKATPAPPVGTALGPHGINIIEFTKSYNEKTSDKAGQVIPAQITVYEDRSFTFILKTPPAADMLRKAAGISAAGHVAAMRSARPGAYEYELEAVAEMTFRKLGAERLGYPSIVGSGINGTTLHYDQNRAKTAAGDLIVMDMAAEFGYYSADVTRTIPVTGTFTDRQRAIYNLVLGAQQAVMDSIRPGTTLGRLHMISAAYIRDHSNGLCGATGCEKYYIHGCCHHIGMDVHDVNTNGSLMAGMTFTVEPGIYLPEEKLGVRIEDDVLVTPTGYELLSGGAPRKAEEVEKIVGR